MALHHEQNIEKMGGLSTQLPITHACFLIGALSLSAIPPFSGFFSKDAILMAVEHSDLPVATLANWMLTLGAGVTGIYIFRALALCFYGQKPEFSFDVKEPNWTITLPLIVLSIPSIGLGYYLIDLWFHQQIFNSVFDLLPAHQASHNIIVAAYQNPTQLIFHALDHLAFWVTIIAITATICVLRIYPHIGTWLSHNTKTIQTILIHQYGFDIFYSKLVCLSRAIARVFFKRLMRL